MTPITTMGPVVLSAEEIAALPTEPLGPGPGVVHKVLWRSEDSMAGVLTVPAGERLGSHRHRANHHHIWVLAGRAVILGSELGPGSYAHVPLGVDHDIDASDTEGCTALYLYLR